MRPGAAAPLPARARRLRYQVESLRVRTAKLARAGARQASGVSFPSAVRQGEEEEATRGSFVRKKGATAIKDVRYATKYLDTTGT